MLKIFLAFGAGITTCLSPCILPMLPILLGVSVVRAAGEVKAFRYRPIFIMLGFILAFVSTVLLFGASTHVFGFSQDTLRTGGIIVLFFSGLLLLIPVLFERVMRPLGRVSNVAHKLGNFAGPGNFGGLILGVGMGLMWTPCAGPVLASILSLIATEQQDSQTISMLIAYTLGASIPMLIIAYGGQAITSRIRSLTPYTGTIKKVFGVMVIASASAMYFEVDIATTAWAGNQAGSDDSIFTKKSAHRNSHISAPEFVGIEAWINSTPLTMEQLRGQVVLVDFWTYDCINCINTLPYIKKWHQRYKDKGLVVVGIHTPEFSFERLPNNVQKAVRRFDITYPVAQDNRYKTWTAWGTEAWPTLYLVDREGRIIFKHVGEGDYEHIEQQIQKAIMKPH